MRQFAVSDNDYAARVQKRDAREAMDTRTPAQVWLSDPPANRPTLAQIKNARTNYGGTNGLVRAARSPPRLLLTGDGPD